MDMIPKLSCTTRKLAPQIYEARKFSYQAHVRPSNCYRGADIASQIHNIKQGRHLCVITLGHLVDRMKPDCISRSLQYCVLDKANEMLGMGLEPQIWCIVQQDGTPPSGVR